MGAEASKGGGGGAQAAGAGPLPVLTFPTDITVPEVGAPSAAPVHQASPVPDGTRDNSLDQLPSMPAVEAAAAAIIRDFGDYRREADTRRGCLRQGPSRHLHPHGAPRCRVIKRKLNERAEVLLQRVAREAAAREHRPPSHLHHHARKYYLVMEYCEGGDLLVFINNSPLLSDELARTLFVGLLEGIASATCSGSTTATSSSRTSCSPRVRACHAPEDRRLWTQRLADAAELALRHILSPLYAAPS